MSKQKWKEGLDDRGPFLGHNGRRDALVETTWNQDAKARVCHLSKWRDCRLDHEAEDIPGKQHGLVPPATRRQMGRQLTSHAGYGP